MDVFGLIAALIAILGVLAAAGYGGYLLMLRSVAAKRPGAGEFAGSMSKRLPAAGGLTLLALVGLLFTNGGVVPDVIGLLLGGGAGAASLAQFQAARRQLASPPR